LLFLGPQVINFLYSVPQLFRLVPCPRHRMPAYAEEEDAVCVSFTDWFQEKSINKLVLLALERGGLAKVERMQEGELIRVSNLTLINLTIWKLGGGPFNEGKLTYFLLLCQVIWVAIAFAIRYHGAALFYAIVE
jgi:UDP-N-acetylglucosamine--dolichyl-phosphate N-acetylglucosaminephosphotransferase